MQTQTFSDRWTSLHDAYGPATTVPALLDHLDTWARQHDLDGRGLPQELAQDLWSRLCHQGTVYTASYAAFPNLVEAIAVCGATVPFDLLQLVVSIDLSRRDGVNGPKIPPELTTAYVDALVRLPALMAPVLLHAPDEQLTRCALAVNATAAGHADLARVLLDLDPDRLHKVLTGLWV